MRLSKWIDKEQERDPSRTRLQIVRDLAERAGVSLAGLEPVSRGARMSFYKKARAVSEATRWQVDILDLCEEHPEEMRKRLISPHR